jgi:membrane associated rhomboid family serine protease
MRIESNDWVVVRRCAERREAELYALVLSARGISSAIVHGPGGFGLLVAPARADQAILELTAYDAENQDWWTTTKRIRSTPPNIELVLAYWAVLLFFFAAARRDFLSIDWLEIGSAQAGSIRSGDWWRVITALFLHESGFHLLGNLAFGTVFLLLLSQVLGRGMSALAAIASGAVGNLLDILVRPASHTVIGASTAIFGTVGLLASLQYQSGGDGRVFSKLRDWAPIGGGVMLLAFLGLGGEQTDILAHVFGFGSGVGLGAVLARSDRRWLDDRHAQVWSAWAAGVIALLAWLSAILLRP